LGYVETAKVAFVREALIGIAPLIAGSAVVVLIGYSRLAIGPLAMRSLPATWPPMSRGLIDSLRSADSFILDLFTLRCQQFHDALRLRTVAPGCP